MGDSTPAIGATTSAVQLGLPGFDDATVEGSSHPPLKVAADLVARVNDRLGTRWSVGRGSVAMQRATARVREYQSSLTLQELRDTLDTILDEPWWTSSPAPGQVFGVGVWERRVTERAKPKPTLDEIVDAFNAHFA
jgi:hypothetical protein